MRQHLETALAGRLSGTPVGLDLVNIVRPGAGRRVLQAACDLATLTVANSKATASVLADRTRVKIIHPGVDLDRFYPQPAVPSIRQELGPDRKLVAIVGRLDVRKGIQTLVDAMDLLGAQHPDSKLIVVGTAGTGPVSYAQALQAGAEGRLGDRVQFLGRRDDVAQILNSVDVLVNASVAEPFGLTALEAQACRTPVVGTEAGGLVEFVTHGETGLLVPPDDPKAMAEAIGRLLDEPELAEALAEKAFAAANPHRGLEVQYDDIAEMYRGLAAEGAK